MTIRRLPLIAAVLALPLLLTACASTAPATPKTAQATSDKTFSTLRTTISKSDTLDVKNHKGRAYIPGTCSGNQVQLTDTSAVYVKRDFDQNAYLSKLQQRLNNEQYQTSLGKIDAYQTLLFSKDGYSYQALATTNVKDSKLDTNKAILFVSASPCMDR